jgi:glutamate dehydrogenase/leucine dehydrogenase
MAFKNASAGLPHGGGNSVVLADPKMPLHEEERLIRAFVTAIGNLAKYIPGPDMGTDGLAMGWIKDETGRAVGQPREIGRIPLDEIGATGCGLTSAIDVARKYIDMPLEGARVAIQGFGSVASTRCSSSSRKAQCWSLLSDTSGKIGDEDGSDCLR